MTMGRYRHYKGAEYQVLGLARHSETEEWLVLYRPCYGDQGYWVRPYAMFVEHVMHPETGLQVPRFALIEASVDARPTDDAQP
ncbi:hypothetical protein BFW38_01645 [Terasakiispira papahanaumokuakeensis]|uniref:DUF1653 domain-containing protein n=2 Tax=Terasakiispira papahanaumokuakeensis TaxID=197479 RepID=A0A1E2VE56_9GAMM|nr:DUF1653 domain-containing protein [Terasakiispira papahanaumokuakeensis]ODC05116.1 hypothetical protein BFW38_01645 [Terasakiispira papahanaumokuakeensis]